MSQFMPRFIVVATALGFGALLWALFSLLLIIEQERKEAFDNLLKKEQELEQRVNLRFREMSTQLKIDASAKINKAIGNPFLVDSNLLYYQRGKRVLPRQTVSQFNNKNIVFDIHKNLMNKKFRLLMQGEDGIWHDRVRLYQSFILALTNGKSALIERGFKKILEHRSLYVIDARYDIPYMLALLEHFVIRGNPNDELMRIFLTEGFRTNSKTEIQDLPTMLLARRAKFNQLEFDFLAKKLLSLMDRYQLPTVVLKNRLVKTVFNGPEWVELINDAYLKSGDWLIYDYDGQSAKGIRSPIEILVDGIQKEYKTLGLLHVDDQILLTNPITPVMHLNKITLRIGFIDSANRRQNLQARYLYKLALIVACGLLALITVVLVIMYQYRKDAHIKLQSDFLAAVSHELRTPLTSIRLLAETLEYRLENGKDTRDYPQRMVEDIDRLVFLVENILSYNRLQKKFWKFQKFVIDFDEIISHIRNQIHLYTEKEIEISFESQSNDKILADPELLKLLLTNLIKNSCYYNSNDLVKIKLIQKKLGSKQIIEYSDNGMGIKPQHWKKVFNEFFRLPGEHTQNIRGSGLGLSICKKIMKLHKGNIRIVESSGSGTVFHLQFGR